MRARPAVLAGIAVIVSTSALPAQMTGWRPGSGRPTFASVPARAEWFHDRTRDAYAAATNAGRPLVIMVGEDGDHRYTTQMIREILPSTEFDRLAGSAVLAYANPSVDPDAKSLVETIKVERYPTILLLAPNSEKIEVIATVEGILPAQTIVDFLSRHMREHGWLTNDVSTGAR